MTKKEIIDETVEYYKTHERGYDASINVCVYTSSTDAKCAIGFRMNPKSLEKYKNYQGAVDDLLSDSSENIDNILELKYKGHDLEFWLEIQSFHDNSRNWDSHKLSKGNTLTEEGEYNLKRLLNKYT